jgi:tRNA pseudouridine38-40 synthase
MSGFLTAAKAFTEGLLASSLHSEAQMRLADKTLLAGKESISSYLVSHPGFFAGMERISPDSEATVSYKNGLGDFIKLFPVGNLVGKIVEFHPDDVRQRIRVTVEYDGTDFAGFQTQTADRTVQSELMKVVSMVNDRPTPVTGASRTDAGVHAYGQVVHFDTKHDFSESKWRMILNHALPHDIHVVSVEKVHPVFHARFDVYSKEYHYALNLGDPSALRRNYEWALDRMLDLDILKAELAKIVGTHDFQSFCKGENESTIRTIFSAEMAVEGDHVTLIFIGNGFLHNMIRLLVGALVNIASGKTDADMTAILADRNRDHTHLLAPAGGLYLKKIVY